MDEDFVRAEAIDDPSARKPRRQRRKQARPQELLAAALALFGEKGYSASCMEDVAKRAGVSKGTLYRYFANKEALFKDVVRTQVGISGVDGERHSVRIDDNSLDLLRQTMLGWWAQINVAEAGVITKLMVTEAFNFPELAQSYHDETVARGMAMIAGVIELGVARGEFRAVDPVQLSQVLVAQILCLIFWKHGGDNDVNRELDPHDFLTQLLDVAARGLLPSG